jgi:hypothetical protein
VPAERPAGRGIGSDADLEVKRPGLVQCVTMSLRHSVMHLDVDVAQISVIRGFNSVVVARDAFWA